MKCLSFGSGLVTSRAVFLQPSGMRSKKLGEQTAKKPLRQAGGGFFCEGGIINQKRGLREKEGRKGEIKR